MTEQETRVVSSTGGEKGQKLARFDLLPAGPLYTVAELYGKGAEKYADRNWEKGYDWSLSYAAMQRHANKFWGGVDTDEETGLPHLASVVFHALALMQFAITHPEFDNRPQAEDTSETTEPGMNDAFSKALESIQKTLEKIGVWDHLSPAKPRVWEDVRSIPEGVRYQTTRLLGAVLKGVRNPPGPESYNSCYGPFTEILEEKPKEPRVWTDLRDIPQGVTAKDNEGDSFRWVGDRLTASVCGGSWIDWGTTNLEVESRQLSPFTEVVE